MAWVTHPVPQPMGSLAHEAGYSRYLWGECNREYELLVGKVKEV